MKQNHDVIYGWPLCVCVCVLRVICVYVCYICVFFTFIRTVKGNNKNCQRCLNQFFLNAVTSRARNILSQFPPCLHLLQGYICVPQVGPSVDHPLLSIIVKLGIVSLFTCSSRGQPTRVNNLTLP